MAAVAFLPADTPMVVFPDRSNVWWFDALHAQGPEGKKVSDNARNVLSHWNNRAEALIAGSTPDAYSYQHIPLKIAFHTKARYRHVGRMKPRSFPIDE